MERVCPTIFLIIIWFLSLNCYSKASSCSSDEECFHFEHCCKGNCTSRRIQCEHICTHDSQCKNTHVCVLGLCVNCTDQFSCDAKKCLNDTHCPETHSCEKEVCTVKKPSDLTSEMLPFIIFIAALCVSLLIVCYNDYILERLGHRGCMECLENRVCHCSLFLTIWMWRHRRSVERNNESMTPSCPALEVRFDSRTINPSNTFNEKRETGLLWSIGALKDHLMFWRRNVRSNVRSSNSNDAETRENSNSSQSTRTVSSVVLLNEYMNTNRAYAGVRTTEILNTVTNTNDSRMPGNRSLSIPERNKREQETNRVCTRLPPIFEQVPTSPLSHLECNDDDNDVHTSSTCSNVINTKSHHVTIV